VAKRNYSEEGSSSCRNIDEISK